MSLPIFNDEAIWIDWGNKLKLGFIPLFYSLYDGKPPLHFVFISFFMIFIKEPLLAGRLLSVVAGIFSIIAIKKISVNYLEEKYVFIPCLLYVISPMFLFYDRQALQESILTAEICWIMYFIIMYFNNYRMKYAFLSAIVLAVAFMTKVSVLVYFIPIYLIFTINFIREKERQDKLFIAAIFILLIFFILTLPLFLQKQSSLIFTRNDRYALTLGEININIIHVLIDNILKTLKIYFWYFNTMLIFTVIALISFIKRHVNIKYYYILIFLLPVLLIDISSRGIVDRYVIPYSIPILFLSAIGFYKLVKKYSLVSLLLFIPLLISLFQIVKIDNYLAFMDRYAKGLDLYVYTGGFTSGYGVNNAIKFINNLNDNKIYIGIRVDAGNPESAIMAYFLNDSKSKVVPLYFDSQTTPLPLSSDFIGNYYPFYYISRDDNLGGMNKYLTEIVRYYKPDNKSFVGVYKYNKHD